jgi:glycosyltransferase involved in cell wall biosynthesis
VELFVSDDSGEAFFTVVIPCYKQAAFLRETVESVLEQTFKRIKIIIVNDGSPDNTSSVAREIIEDYPERDIILLEKENGGVSTARNYGIKHAETEWVMPLDADDKLRSDFFDKAYEAISDNPGLNLVTTNLQQFGKGDGEWIPGEYSPQNILYYNTFLSGSIFKKELWEKAGGYYSGIPWGAQDWNFWIDCSRVGITPYKIPGKLFLYRIHGGTSAYDRVKEHWPVVSSCIYTLHPDLYPRQILEKAIEVISKMDSESVERIEKITNRHPELAHPYFWLGLKFEKEGDFSKALELFKIALEKSDTEIFMLRENIEKLSRPDLSESQPELSSVQKLLLACDYFWPSIGGVELFIEDLGQKLKSRGLQIEIALPQIARARF